MSVVDSQLALFDALAKACSFPDYFGRNWDALDDCLTDFTWLAGRWYMCLLEKCDRFALASPQDFGTAMEIFVSASDFWWERRVPFHIFVTGTDRLLSLDYGDAADRICRHMSVA